MLPGTGLPTVRTDFYCVGCRKFYFNTSRHAYGEDQLCTVCAAGREPRPVRNGRLTIRVPAAGKNAALWAHFDNWQWDDAVLRQLP